MYDTIVKLQNDYRQRELDFVHQMEDVVKQRDHFQSDFASLQRKFDELFRENDAMKAEVRINIGFFERNHFFV